MQNKRTITLTIAALIILNLLLLGKYSLVQKVHSKCDSSIHKREKKEQILKDNITTQYQYLIRQYQIEQKDSLLSKVLLFNKNNEWVVFSDIIPDTSFVIWIPQGACDVCISNLLNTISDHYVTSELKYDIHVIVESRNIKKAILLGTEYKSRGFKFHGCDNGNIFTYKERPVCFVYIKNGQAKHPFIPIAQLEKRTKLYFNFLINNYQFLIKKEKHPSSAASSVTSATLLPSTSADL